VRFDSVFEPVEDGLVVGELALGDEIRKIFAP
jgi:hypothetical protein